MHEGQHTIYWGEIFKKSLPIRMHWGIVRRCNHNHCMGLRLQMVEEGTNSASYCPVKSLCVHHQRRMRKSPSKEFTFIHPGCVLCNPAGGLVRAHVDIRRVWYAFTAWVLSVRCHCIPRSPVLASPRSVLQHASLGARRPVRRRLMTARSAGQSMVVGALMRDELKS